jgi:hypothetical protein
MRIDHLDHLVLTVKDIQASGVKLAGSAERPASRLRLAVHSAR